MHHCCPDRIVYNHWATDLVTSWKRKWYILWRKFICSYYMANDFRPWIFACSHQRCYLWTRTQEGGGNQSKITWYISFQLAVVFSRFSRSVWMLEFSFSLPLYISSFFPPSLSLPLCLSSSSSFYISSLYPSLFLL